ncbi:capsular biosynthesis protein [Solimonas sp. K1W22B-7]|uniref:capsular biosynthesis protein n=1 Tax=Solimonas sp. K1W22B-7 TaxID=2303331 RepID=UPI000E330187|nr:capsular biosynthesis protein [Solimonas sp. K1W22B-7]AXQ29911.1 capsular biosynthesis protein [Solimonas sp. K1W22B-7]
MIVIPMVGRSRRFLDAGYTVPKYRLELQGSSVFALAVGSFLEVARDEDLVVVCLRDDGAAAFARTELDRLGMGRGRVVELPAMTLGQADTVNQGLAAASVSDQEPVVIFNVDTFRPGFRYPAGFDVRKVDGYLECFIGSGANWSNAVPTAPGSDRVIRTSEKKQESEYCCTGLYHFGSAAVFRRAYAAEVALHAAAGGSGKGELYVAPIYNHLIAGGGDIRLEIVPVQDVIFCGVPSEYVALQNTPPSALVRHAAQLRTLES